MRAPVGGPIGYASYSYVRWGRGSSLNAGDNSGDNSEVEERQPARRVLRRNRRRLGSGTLALYIGAILLVTAIVVFIALLLLGVV
jgi:hypothetical protein